MADSLRWRNWSRAGFPMGNLLLWRPTSSSSSSPHSHNNGNHSLKQISVRPSLSFSLCLCLCTWQGVASLGVRIGTRTSNQSQVKCQLWLSEPPVLPPLPLKVLAREKGARLARFACGKFAFGMQKIAVSHTGEARGEGDTN